MRNLCSQASIDCFLETKSIVPESARKSGYSQPRHRYLCRLTLQTLLISCGRLNCHNISRAHEIMFRGIQSFQQYDYYIIMFGDPLDTQSPFSIDSSHQSKSFGAQGLFFYSVARCWWGYNLTLYFWILEGPRMAVILVRHFFEAVQGTGRYCNKRIARRIRVCEKVLISLLAFS